MPSCDLAWTPEAAELEQRGYWSEFILVTDRMLWLLENSEPMVMPDGTTWFLSMVQRPTSRMADKPFKADIWDTVALLEFNEEFTHFRMGRAKSRNWEWFNYWRNLLW